MGLALAIFYMPALIVLSLFAAHLSKKLNDPKLKKISSEPLNTFIFITSILTTSGATYFLASLINSKHNHDIEAFLAKICISLLFPMIFGILIKMLAKNMDRNKYQHSVISRMYLFGTGAFHTTWIIPALIIIYAMYS